MCVMKGANASLLSVVTMLIFIGVENLHALLVDSPMP